MVGDEEVKQSVRGAEEHATGEDTTAADAAKSGENMSADFECASVSGPTATVVGKRQACELTGSANGSTGFANRLEKLADSLSINDA